MKMYIKKQEDFIRIAVADNKIRYYNEIYTCFQGDIYVAEIKKISHALNAIFVDYGSEKMGFLNYSSIHPLYKEAELRIGQKLLVQKLRQESISDNKGALLTSYITLGNSFKYVPNDMCDSFSFSDHIDDIYKQTTLKIFQDFDAKGSFELKENPNNLEDFVQELKKTIRLWFNIINKKLNESKNLLYSKDHLSDVLNLYPNIQEVVYYGLNESFLRKYFKNTILVKKKAVFLDLFEQLQDIFSKYICLPSGAYLIFDCCSTGYTIDVNMGSKITVKSAFAFQVNLEAVEESARQIKLRNLSGMILIDFIDLNNSDQKKVIVENLKNLFGKEQRNIKIENVKSGGVVIIFREYKSGIVWKDFLQPSCLKIERQKFDLFCALQECEGEIELTAPNSLIKSIQEEIKHLPLKIKFKTTERNRWKIKT